MARTERSSSEELMVVESSVKGKRKSSVKKKVKRGVIDYADVQKSTSEEDCLIIDDNSIKNNKPSLESANSNYKNIKSHSPNSKMSNTSNFVQNDILKHSKSTLSSNDIVKNHINMESHEQKKSLSKKSSVAIENIALTSQVSSNNISSISESSIPLINSFKNESSVPEENNSKVVDLKNSSLVINKLQNTSNEKEQLLEHSINLSKDQNSYKYTLRFKNGTYEKDFHLNDNDPIELVYSELFGHERDGKILYEGMKLSRFLNVGEAGFFPGLNYIYLPHDEKLPHVEETFIKIKIDSNPDNDIDLKIYPYFIVSDLYSHLNILGIETKGKIFILNGEKLTQNMALRSLLENEYTIDFIDECMVENS